MVVSFFSLVLFLSVSYFVFVFVGLSTRIGLHASREAVLAQVPYYNSFRHRWGLDASLSRFRTMYMVTGADLDRLQRFFYYLDRHSVSHRVFPLDTL